MSSIRVTFFALGVFLCAGSLTSAADPAIETQEGVNQWFIYYYLHPSPENVVPGVRTLAKAGLLDKASTRAPLIAFFGEIFRQNPKSLADWMKQLEGLKPEHQKILWYALWYAGNDPGKTLLQQAKDRAPESDKREIERLLKEPPPDLLEKPVQSPAVLDMLWGKFVATGDARCVQKIISVLPWLDKKPPSVGSGKVDAGSMLIVAGAAQWSLESNAIQHERVLKICQDELSKQPPEVKVILKEIVEKAQKAIQEGKKG